MTILEKTELFKIIGGGYHFVEPKFNAYGKLFNWIFNTINSWF